MNAHQLNSLKSHMFQIGNTHNAVRTVKNFLNSYNAVPVSNLKNDNLFDAETQKALAVFQKVNGLKPTGAMDLKTWLTIGAEMNPISINAVSMGDRTLRDLLQTGYRSKFPFRNAASNKSSTEPITISPANPFPLVKSYEFNFLLYVSVFAPFEWFGPLYFSKGDKASRRFGVDPTASYRLQSFSTITATPGERIYQWTKNYAKTEVSPATDSYLWKPWNPDPDPVKSSGHLRREENTTDFDLDSSIQLSHTPLHLKYHLHGNDDAFAIIGANSWLASDIDVHPNIQFKYTPDKTDWNKIRLRAFGNVVGDQFPCVETFIRDINSNGVMLGVWQIREGDGPVMMREGLPGLPGDKRLPMFDFDITVILEKGIFTGVEKNGRVISLAEHNKAYTDLAPVTGTPIPLEKPRSATHY